jgi:hypothetical protein
VLCPLHEPCARGNQSFMSALNERLWPFWWVLGTLGWAGDVERWRITLP